MSTLMNLYINQKVDKKQLLRKAGLTYTEYRKLWKEHRVNILEVLTERVGSADLAKKIIEENPVSFFETGDINISFMSSKLRGHSSPKLFWNGLVYLGDIAYVNEKEEVKPVPEARIYIDFQEMARGFLAINGKTGYGKTTAVRILAESIALSGIPVIILDPEGDYTNMNRVYENLPFYNCKEIFSSPKEKDKVVWYFTNYSIDISQFRPTELVSMIKTIFPREFSLEMERGLMQAIKYLKSRGASFTWEDLIWAVQVRSTVAENILERLVDILTYNRPDTLLRGEYALNIKNMIGTKEKKLKREKVTIGKINIIDIRDMSLMEQKMVLYFLFKSVLSECTTTNNKRVAIFLEETTLYIDEYDTQLSRFVGEMAERGRKRGILLGMVSRAVAKIPPTAKRETRSSITFHLQLTSATEKNIINWGVPEDRFRWLRAFGSTKDGGWCMLTGRFCRRYYVPETFYKQKGINTEQYNLDSYIPLRLRHPITLEGIKEYNRIVNKITL